MGTGLIRFLLALLAVVLVRRLWRGLRGSLGAADSTTERVHGGGPTPRTRGTAGRRTRLSSEQPIEDAEYEDLD